jgi:hypothetical protein
LEPELKKDQKGRNVSSDWFFQQPARKKKTGAILTEEKPVKNKKQFLEKQKRLTRQI